VKELEGCSEEAIALRVSQDIPEGTYVNLGIGIPTLVANWIEGRDIILQSEIGMLKSGPLAGENCLDQDCTNAGGEPVTELPGSAYFDICDSFAMIRGGYIDITILGAYQVSERGDFCGWNNPERELGNVGNIGGSMDLAAGGGKIFLAMRHTTKDGHPKILRRLTYPPTALGRVQRIFTDISVIEVTPEGLVLREYFPGLTPEGVQSVTEPNLIVSPSVKEMEL